MYDVKIWFDMLSGSELGSSIWWDEPSLRNTSFSIFLRSNGKTSHCILCKRNWVGESGNMVKLCSEQAANVYRRNEMYRTHCASPTSKFDAFISPLVPRNVYSSLFRDWWDRAIYMGCTCEQIHLSTNSGGVSCVIGQQPFRSCAGYWWRAGPEQRTVGYEEKRIVDVAEGERGIERSW